MGDDHQSRAEMHEQPDMLLRWLDRGVLGALVVIGLAVIGFFASVYSRLGVVETEVRNVNTSMLKGQRASDASLEAIQRDIRILWQQEQQETIRESGDRRPREDIRD